MPPRQRTRSATAAVMTMADEELARYIEQQLRTAGIDNVEGVSTGRPPEGEWAVYLRFGSHHELAERVLAGIPRIVDVHVSPAAVMSSSIICFRVEPAKSPPR